MSAAAGPVVTRGTPDAAGVARFLGDAMRRHFGEATGSPFWLSVAGELDFDPVRDVVGWRDLERFRPWARRARAAAPRDLLAAAGTDDDEIVAPELPLPRTWLEQVVDWRVARYARGPGRTVGDTLVLLPAGYGFARAVSTARAGRLGSGAVFANRPAEAPRILDRGGVAYVVTTVELLEGLLDQAPPQAPVWGRIRHITLYDAHRWPARARRLREVLPESCEISAILSCPGVLAEFRTGLFGRDGGPLVYEGFDPYVRWELADETGRPAGGPGDTATSSAPGVLAVSHLSDRLFLPWAGQPVRAVPADGGRPGPGGVRRFEIPG
ncbi:hypothetical protein [Myceligenerans crystallogenes]|uniref:Phenazine antibiotic biosynthesis protein n=1 Tax=Myceligenerans crystallogenes TaxID=316335 RepID=A0ABP4ZFW8_9MICO